MHFATGTVMATVLTATIAVQANAQDTAQLGPADGHDLPPTEIDRVAVGVAAPDFTLARHGGGTITLSDYRGDKNIVLVFYRGYWCPYCIRQLGELRTLLDPELEMDTELVVVSIDGENETSRTIARVAQDGVEPDFTFLMDPGHQVIDRYGILNPDDRRGLPHPATYVIDKEGDVRWRFIETDYRIRPGNDVILEALRALGGS